MVTINDVAKKAQVSKSTVSNVFSDKKYTSPELRARVLAVAKELNYKSNYYAKTLATKESRVISIAVNATQKDYSTFHQNILKGILEVCAQKGYFLLINPLNHDVNSYFPVDGEIIMDPAENDQQIRERHHIWIGRPPLIAGEASFVDNDNYLIGQQVTGFLVQNGLKKLGFLNTFKETTVAKERKKGYLSVVAKQKIKVNHHQFLQSKQDPRQFAYEAIQKLLLDKQVDGLIVDSDAMAHGVYQACFELGVSIPEELSVIAICSGFHDQDAFQPRLTTVELNEFELGKQAGQMLIKKLPLIHKK